jgi:hypothetical protein
VQQALKGNFILANNVHSCNQVKANICWVVENLSLSLMWMGSFMHWKIFNLEASLLLN